MQGSVSFTAKIEKTGSGNEYHVPNESRVKIDTTPEELRVLADRLEQGGYCAIRLDSDSSLRIKWSGFKAGLDSSND